MVNVAEWIEQLKHPLVLAGFGLFILAIFLKPILSNSQDKISRSGAERLMGKAINFVFILAFLVIVIGFILSLTPEELTNKANTQQDITTKTKVSKIIEQHTSGEKSPAITGSDVQINYGGTLPSQKNTKSDKETEKKQTTSKQLRQKTTGDKSPAINSSGNVSINYEE